MDEVPAAFGIPNWLPPGARRSVALAEAQVQRENRAAEREREERLEQRRTATIEAVRVAAEDRGQPLNPIDLAAGRLTPRPLAAIFGEAQAQADAADAREAARRRREGEPAPQHIDFSATEPTIHASPVRRSILSRSRTWQRLQTARRDAENAQRGLDAMNDWGALDVERRAR